MTEVERMEKIRALKAEVETSMLRVSEIIGEAARLGANFYFEHQTHGDSNYLQFVTVIEKEIPPWLLAQPDPDKAQEILSSIFSSDTKH